MKAIIIDGKRLSEKFLHEVGTKVVGERLDLKLAIVQVGNLASSTLYVSNKMKICRSVGILSVLHKIEETASEDEVISLIKNLNQDKYVTAILVQLPLPKHMNTSRIINTIAAFKDVDGLTFLNQGKLLSGVHCVVPCTPLGIIELIKSVDENLVGKHAVIMGRSLIVGKPLSQLLLRENCTVSVLHSKTVDAQKICKTADILICATGSAQMVDESYVNENAIVIDVGISKINGITVGDVCFDRVVDKVKAITPVPGGVGPMTIAMLMQNIYQLGIE